MDSKTKIMIGISVGAVLLLVLMMGSALIIGIMFASRTAQAQEPSSVSPALCGQAWTECPAGSMGSWGHGSMMGSGGHGGMMGDWRYGPAPAVGEDDSVTHGPDDCPMMGGSAWDDGTGEPISMEQAITAAEQYIAAYDNPDLALVEVMEFSENFYAEVEEESTGIHAFELLINRYSGAVYPEPGPNMMWNTKYGHMGGHRGGMMGGGWGGASADEMTVSPEQARQAAQQYLDRSMPGTTVDTDADAFYGYYTLHVLRDGEISGMLSVHGYNGQVWYHDWHGDFIGMEHLEH